MNATIGPCAECGEEETATINTNTAGNPRMLCGTCLHKTHDGIYATARIADNGHTISVTCYDDLTRVTIGGEYSIASMNLYTTNLPELIAALYVALARQEAAQGVLSNG